MQRTDFSKMHLIVPPLKLDGLDVSELVEINVHDMEGTMCVQPKRQAQASLLGREAERQLAKAKHDRENLEYEIRRSHKTACRLSGERPLNEDIAAECHASVLWQNLTLKIQELTHAAAVLQSLERSMEQRFGMVQQISKRRSAELHQIA
jgi:hypothetical protein